MAVRVRRLSGAETIAAGMAHTCVIATTGAALCWGYNFSGQIGDGTTNHRSTPVKVDDLGAVTSIAGGVEHTCAVLAELDREVLGPQRRCPAWRRDDQGADDAGRGRRADRGDPGRPRADLHLCPARRWQRVVLGQQRQRPARRRHFRSPPSPDPGHRRRGRHGDRRELDRLRLRPARRRQRDLLGPRRAGPAGPTGPFGPLPAGSRRPPHRPSRWRASRGAPAGRGGRPRVRRCSPTPPSPAGARTTSASSATARSRRARAPCRSPASRASRRSPSATRTPARPSPAPARSRAGGRGRCGSSGTGWSSTARRPRRCSSGRSGASHGGAREREIAYIPECAARASRQPCRRIHRRPRGGALLRRQGALVVSMTLNAPRRPAGVRTRLLIPAAVLLVAVSALAPRGLAGGESGARRHRWRGVGRRGPHGGVRGRRRAARRAVQAPPATASGSAVARTSRFLVRWSADAAPVGAVGADGRRDPDAGPLDRPRGSPAGTPGGAPRRDRRRPAVRPRHHHRRRDLRPGVAARGGRGGHPRADRRAARRRVRRAGPVVHDRRGSPDERHDAPRLWGLIGPPFGSAVRDRCARRLADDPRRRHHGRRPRHRDRRPRGPRWG